MKAFNINETVYVKLNEIGMQKLRDHYSDWCSNAAHPKIRRLFQNTVKSFEEKFSKKELIGFQLWNLFEIFGKDCSFGESIGFENGEILFPD